MQTLSPASATVLAVNTPPVPAPTTITSNFFNEFYLQFTTLYFAQKAPHKLYETSRTSKRIKNRIDAQKTEKMGQTAGKNLWRCYISPL
jgi:hypothetical protein